MPRGACDGQRPQRTRHSERHADHVPPVSILGSLPLATTPPIISRHSKHHAQLLQVGHIGECVCRQRCHANDLIKRAVRHPPPLRPHVPTQATRNSATVRRDDALGGLERLTRTHRVRTDAPKPSWAGVVGPLIHWTFWKVITDATTLRSALAVLATLHPRTVLDRSIARKLAPLPSHDAVVRGEVSGARASVHRGADREGGGGVKAWTEGFISTYRLS